jgi:alpha-ribazole phosphatase
MGTRLYLVRHGETQWNAVNKIQGHSDIPLSLDGRRQAEKLEKLISNLNIDVVYSSDLIRAVTTAEIILSELKLPINKHQNLREINFGHWEGCTFKEINEKYQEAASRWRQDPDIINIPGGEKLSEVVQRTMAVIYSIINDHPDQNVLIVCHGGVIRAIICSIMGIDLKRYWRLRLENCSLSILHFPDNVVSNGTLELYNYTELDKLDN